MIILPEMERDYFESKQLIMASTILFPTDFSEAANKALRFVLPFAEKLEARLILMNAFTIPTPVAEAPFYSWEEDLRRQEALVRAELEILQAAIQADHPRLKTELIASVGFPVSTILSIADEYEVDWIVMGTKGATGLKKVFLGSVASQVIGRSAKPVLAIPDTAKAPEIHRIVFATNYESRELEPLRRVCRLAERLDAELLVAHVFTGNGQPPVEAWEAFEKMVVSEISYPKLSFKFLPHHDLIKGLEDLLQYTRAEMLAMCPHKRALLDRMLRTSNTKNMASQTQTPLLSMPEDR
ncbi:MAG: universal stress protein [Bacteroidota bacterium]